MTSDNLLILLERRLDNVAFRLGFGDSRAQARQIVRHGHIRVNDRRVDIPSYLVKAGDVVSWRPQSAKTACTRSLQSKCRRGMFQPGCDSTNNR